MKILIVGGGSAGWMTAASLIKAFPHYDISLVESPDIPIIGVGESTINGLRQFCNFLQIDEQDFLKYTDGSYKLSIKFTDFYEKDSGSFLYPFGIPELSGNRFGLNDWLIKKYAYPETPLTDFAECYSPQAVMCKTNRFFKNPGYSLMDGYDSDLGLAYHFDATKFGSWLRERYCMPRGVSRIVGNVKEIATDNGNIKNLTLEDETCLEADLYIDCTGFKSLLLDKALHEEFISYEDLLPNNTAWAAQLPYLDKETELEPFTNCTAIDNGWIWNIPLWSRLGTGYVFNNKFISDDEAKEQFKQYLMSNKMKIPRSREQVESLTYKKINMRVGIHKRTFVGNTVAIGLAAGFIEPLESNGLYTVHQFLFELVRTLSRGVPSEWEKHAYNYATFKMFNEFAEFVAMHYSLSKRNDTPYWKAISQKDFFAHTKGQGPSTFTQVVDNRAFTHVTPITGGYSWIQIGMNYFPLDWLAATLGEMEKPVSYKEFYKDEIEFLENRKFYWEHISSTQPSLFEYLRDNIYN